MKPLPIVRHGNSESRKVALTFDDGPNPYATPAILDILKREDCKASFFLIGRRVDTYPDIVRRIFNEGHTLGGHTHKHGGNSGKEAFHEFVLGNESIEKITGMPVRYVRVPQIMYNAVDRDVPRVKELFELPLSERIERRDLIVSDCSVITHDWITFLPKFFMLAKVRAQLRGGAVINMHDGSEKESELATRARRTFEMLPQLIQDIRAKGFEIVDISQLDPIFETKSIRTV